MRVKFQLTNLLCAECSTLFLPSRVLYRGATFAKSQKQVIKLGADSRRAASQLTPPCHFSSPLDALEKFHAGSWGKKLLLGNKGQKSVLFKGHS